MVPVLCCLGLIHYLLSFSKGQEEGGLPVKGGSCPLCLMQWHQTELLHLVDKSFNRYRSSWQYNIPESQLRVFTVLKLKEFLQLQNSWGGFLVQAVELIRCCSSSCIYSNVGTSGLQPTELTSSCDVLGFQLRWNHDSLSCWKLFFPGSLDH